MTHLHNHHAGGLHHFPDNEILVTRAELEFGSLLRGCVANTHWLAWFGTTMVELEPEQVGPFPRSLRLTEAGDVTLVPVPGHAPGEVGVLVEDDDRTDFLARDGSYIQGS